MSALLAAALAVAGAADAAPATAAVRRGDLEIRVRVAGTVVPADVFRLKATIEGRIEKVLASTHTWSDPDHPLATMAHKELAAMMDARGSQDQGVLEDRWRRVYRPTPIRCPAGCFVLKSYAKPREWVKPQTLLFEAAARLHLVGRVRPEDVHWVRDGQPLVFWPVSDPSRRLTGKIARFVLDVQGEKVAPGGGFVLELGPGRSLDPGTEWEGVISAGVRKDVSFVPTAALITFEGASYLPVRVATGVTTTEYTQIIGGVEDRKPVLVLDDAGLKGLPRHAPKPDPEALRRRAAGEPGTEQEPGRRPRRRLGDIDDYGEDPYGDE